MSKTYRNRTLDQLAFERPGGPMGKTTKALRRQDHQRLDEWLDEWEDLYEEDDYSEIYDNPY